MYCSADEKRRDSFIRFQSRYLRNPKQSASSPLFTMLGLFAKLKLFRHRNLLVRITPHYIKLTERTNGAGARGIHGDTRDETLLCPSKNTTQSELPRVVRQLDEYRNIYGLRDHVSLCSSRTYVTLNSVLSTSQHKRVQGRCG